MDFDGAMRTLQMGSPFFVRAEVWAETKHGPPRPVFACLLVERRSPASGLAAEVSPGHLSTSIVDGHVAPFARIFSTWWAPRTSLYRYVHIVFSTPVSEDPGRESTSLAVTTSFVTLHAVNARTAIAIAR